MVNQYTLTERLDNLEERYYRFKKDFSILLFAKLVAVLFFGMFIMSTNYVVSIILLLCATISTALGYTMLVIMIRRIWSDKPKWINK